MQLSLVKFYTTVDKEESVTAEYITVVVSSNNRIILNKVFECQEGPLPDVFSDETALELILYTLMSSPCDALGDYEGIIDIATFDLPCEHIILSDLKIRGLIK